jgi:AraC family transcriptional regulator
MSNKQSLVLDPTNLGSVAAVLPPTPTLVSAPTDNQGMLLMHYDQIPAHEVPEYSALHHIVAIWGQQSEAKLETKFDDHYRWQGIFGRGEAGVIPAGMNHWAVWDQPIALTVLFLHPKLLEQVAAERGMGDRIELMPNHAIQDPSLTQLGWLIKADLAAGECSDRLYRDSLAMAFVSRLLNHHTVCRIDPQTIDSSLSTPRMQMLLSYIHDNLEQELRLADLAQLVELSEYHLCRIFKQSMGLPLHQYVIQQRIERAKRLLRHQNMTITTIAHACGFSSHSHLTHHFKRLVGVTPRVARSQDHKSSL